MSFLLPPLNAGFLLGAAFGVAVAQRRDYSMVSTIAAAVALGYAAGKAYEELDYDRSARPKIA